MTEKEFHKIIHTMHMEQVDSWLQDTEVTMGLVVTTSQTGNTVITKVARIRTPEDVATICRVITRDHEPVRRTVVFRSWMIPKEVAYDGGTDKLEMIMLLDGEEFTDGFEMSVGKKGKDGKWGFKVLVQKDEGKHMYLGPEMIWMAYSAKLFTSSLEKAGVAIIGTLPSLLKTPADKKEEPPPVILDGLKVAPMAMPQVPDGMQID
jgi:hypothetical protein